MRVCTGGPNRIALPCLAQILPPSRMTDFRIRVSHETTGPVATFASSSSHGIDELIRPATLRRSASGLASAKPFHYRIDFNLVVWKGKVRLYSQKRRSVIAAIYPG